MLILTRKVGESIAIGDEITIKVLGFVGRQVRLGIIAPTYIPVHREEIYKKIQREQERGEAPVGITKQEGPGFPDNPGPEKGERRPRRIRVRKERK